jgi:hypothetical protein
MLADATEFFNGLLVTSDSFGAQYSALAISL